ncbi:hypothetical protein JD276_11730 [Leucobacter sp. CSA1]|uniref:Uncharacterized protein n=1 Tax=Leucobacter chromiisoli TaxID=2796471 RepID=A0A934UUN7_9MICO|nr:DUF6350 family protein [Leucobacter chromiisoli]MBK0419704.1 hypothetical protein [Leucobacter chromiisoli]
MRPFLTAVVAAIEAAAVALAGLIALAIPAVVLWAATFELASDPGEVFGGAAAVWLLAHLVPLSLEVSAETASGLGLAPEALGVPLSLAPLGATLITVLLAGRSGWRLAARGGTGAAGVLGGPAGFAVVAALAVPFARPLLDAPAWAAIALPSAVYAASSAAAFLLRSAVDGSEWWLRTVRGLQLGLERSGLPGVAVAALPGHLRETFRVLLASVAGLVGLGALGAGAALVIGYVEITALAQGLQLDPLGAVLLFLLQLALLPIVVLWAVAWFTGAGFAIGEATSVSPFETMLGPLPSLPLLGAVPQGWGEAGALAPALVVLLGVGIGLLAARRSELRRSSWPAALVTTALAAALTGLVVAGGAALAIGAVGPGRLAVTGPEPWLVGGLAAAELGGGLLLGVCAGRADRARLRAALPVPGDRRRRSTVAADLPAAADTPTGNADLPSSAADLPSADADLPTEDLSGVREPASDPRSRLLSRAASWFGGSRAGEAEASGPDPTGSAPGQRGRADAAEESDPVDATPPVAAGSGDEADGHLDRSAHIEEEDRGEHDTEALLRAYSWDRAPEQEPSEARKRPGWRSPRGKR